MDTLEIKNKIASKNNDRVMVDKIQKLTSALYRVTDLFSDKEPLKWALRNKAISIYESFILAVSSSSDDNDSIVVAMDKSVEFNKILDCISQIISALELASMGSFVSSLNFKILKREYENLKAFIEGKRGDIVSEQKLIPDFSIASTSPVVEPKKEENSIGQIPVELDSNGHLSVHENKKDSNGHLSPVANSIKPVAKIDPPIKQKNEDNTIENKGNKDDRKQKIQEFLMEKGSKTISEIAVIFSDISEKTIQRDLLGLVKMGKLKMQGEKRWRRYQLI